MERKLLSPLQRSLLGVQGVLKRPPRPPSVLGGEHRGGVAHPLGAAFPFSLCPQLLT